jgi:hypothetical protein
MQFSDFNNPWQQVPPWVGFLIRFGFEWPAVSQARRIALVSMPCDSPGAGLIALGAMLRDLGNATANDIDGHYEALLRHAKQFLTDCQPCDLLVCNPEIRRCGHAKMADGKIRSSDHPHGFWTVSEETNFRDRTLAWRKGAVTHRPTVNGALRWHIDGEPPTQVRATAGVLPDYHYAKLVEGARILPENLRRSFSGLCLAGRVAGEEQSRELCASIRFRDGESERRLDDLLTIYGWSTIDVSRMTFYNSRTEQLDRSKAPPALVVADGGDSFLKVSSASRFQHSDVIGVIQRTMERTRLEAIGDKFTALRQWYVQDEDMLCGLPALPNGISISIFRRRN